jgi:hypothetical protein
MVQYLRELLASGQTFTIWGKRLIAVDEVGIVLEGPVLRPWAKIIYLGIEFQ